MIAFVLRRAGTMAVTLSIISALVFFIIKLPPGGLPHKPNRRACAPRVKRPPSRGRVPHQQYGLDRPVWEQYLSGSAVCRTPNGFAGLLQGDWGWSFEFDRPVTQVVCDALWLTLLINLVVVVFVHVVAIPIAIYSATRQYSVGDYIATFIGYIGLRDAELSPRADPALLHERWFGISIGGLIRPSKFAASPDLAEDPVPALASDRADPRHRARRNGRHDPAHARQPPGRAQQAVLRDRPGEGHALHPRPDQIPVPDVAKPVHRGYRQSLASPHFGLGPVSLVLSLPTVGPILLAALKSQDQFLAGFILMFVAVLTVVGMLISDLLLAWLDPRIRLSGR
jgi:peptide/nickel transport system permease protein